MGRYHRAYLIIAQAIAEPLVLYHGSPLGGLTALMEGSGGKYMRVSGIYLTKNRAEAEKYTKVDGAKHPENVYTVLADIRNPATREILDELGYRLDGDQMREELIRMGYDGVVDDLMDEVVAFDPRQLTIVAGGTAMKSEVNAGLSHSPDPTHLSICE